MRYKSIAIKRNDDGKRAMVTAIMPKIRVRPTDSYIVMVERTRLDHLAHKFYNNQNHWWIIATANNIRGTMYAELGIQLRIPREIGDILSEFNRINS